MHMFNLCLNCLASFPASSCGDKNSTKKCDGRTYGQTTVKLYARQLRGGGIKKKKKKKSKIDRKPTDNDNSSNKPYQ